MGKESACNEGATGDMGLILGLEKAPGGAPGVDGSPLQYSCLGNPMEREAWWATIHGVSRVRHN